MEIFLKIYNNSLYNMSKLITWDLVREKNKFMFPFTKESFTK